MTGRAIYAKNPIPYFQGMGFWRIWGADSYFPLSIFLISLSLLSASTGVRLLMSSPPWLVAAAYLPRQRATLTFICSRCLAPRGSVKSRVALTA